MTTLRRVILQSAKENPSDGVEDEKPILIMEETKSPKPAKSPKELKLRELDIKIELLQPQQEIPLPQKIVASPFPPPPPPPPPPQVIPVKTETPPPAAVPVVVVEKKEIVEQIPVEKPSKKQMEKELSPRGSNRKPKTPSSSTATPTSNPNVVIQAMEWVQCESCKKWRKLPLSVQASSLPDTWICEMNTWNRATASCSALEEDSEPYGIEVETGNSNNNATSTSNIAAETNSSINPSRGRTIGYLPPGINLYGGQSIQAAQAAASQQKNARVISYRDLIAAHYRNHKTFNPVYDKTCDNRYKAFSAYISPTLKSKYDPKQPKLLLRWNPPSTVSKTLPPNKRHRYEVVTALTEEL